MEIVFPIPSPDDQMSRSRLAAFLGELTRLTELEIVLLGVCKCSAAKKMEDQDERE